MGGGKESLILSHIFTEYWLRYETPTPTPKRFSYLGGLDRNLKVAFTSTYLHHIAKLNKKT